MRACGNRSEHETQVKWSAVDRRWVARRLAHDTANPDRLQCELPQLLTKVFGVPVDQGRLFELLDKNLDGKVTRKEFADAFDILDANKDGVLTPAELQEMSSRLAKPEPPMLLGTPSSKFMIDHIVDAVITGRTPPVGGDANVALDGRQALREGARGQPRGLLEASKLLSGYSYEPYSFPCSYLPTTLQHRLAKQIVGRQQRFVECSPVMLLTYTIAAYPLYVASEFPVWDLESPWDFER
jgi:hypothetical protein